MRGRTPCSPGLASRAAPMLFPTACPVASSAGWRSRALINSPSLLLADEPTSDLDEDSEADIIDLLERLQRSDGFGFVLVTHNLEVAKHAQRIYLMRQGVLSATDLPEVVAAERRPRHFRPAEIPPDPEPTAPAAAGEPALLGRDLWRGLPILFLVGAAIVAAVVLLDFAVEQYQRAQLHARSL